ncbi:MAG: CsbD family protein [Acidobacteriaceae bacterium]
MSTATESKVKGKFDEVAGKVKQSFGEATNNDRVANEGTAQQVKGHAEQAWGSVKDAANATTPTRSQVEATHEQKAHDVREKVTTTAQNVKNRIQDSAADYRAKHEK